MMVTMQRATTSTKVDDNGDGAKLSSLLMCRRLCCHCDSVVALLMMALPSLMQRRLAVVDDDGNGMTGDDNYDDFDDATDFAIIATALLPSLQWRQCRC